MFLELCYKILQCRDGGVEGAGGYKSWPCMNFISPPELSLGAKLLHNRLSQVVIPGYVLVFLFFAGTTLDLLKFPIMRAVGYRLERRVKRLLKDRDDYVEEERLRKKNLRETGKLKFAHVVGRPTQVF